MDGCYLQSSKYLSPKLATYSRPTSPLIWGNNVVNSLCYPDTVITSDALIIIILPTSFPELCNITEKSRIAQKAVHQLINRNREREMK